MTDSPLGGPPGDALAPYRHLIELLERELALAAAGQINELADAVERRASFSARLPAVPPAGAGELLRRLTALNARASIEAGRCREALRGTLAALPPTRRRSAGPLAGGHRLSISA